MITAVTQTLLADELSFYLKLFTLFSLRRRLILAGHVIQEITSSENVGMFWFFVYVPEGVYLKFGEFVYLFDQALK